MKTASPYFSLVVAPTTLLWLSANSAFVHILYNSPYDPGNNVGEFTGLVMGACFLLICVFASFCASILFNRSALRMVVLWLASAIVLYMGVEFVTPWSNDGHWRLLHYLERFTISLGLSVMALIWARKSIMSPTGEALNDKK